jgi:hypothetical protein
MCWIICISTEVRVGGTSTKRYHCYGDTEHERSHYYLIDRLSINAIVSKTASPKSPTSSHRLATGVNYPTLRIHSPRLPRYSAPPCNNAVVDVHMSRVFPVCTPNVACPPDSQLSIIRIGTSVCSCALLIITKSPVDWCCPLNSMIAPRMLPIIGVLHTSNRSCI